jgi:hypothetical protein
MSSREENKKMKKLWKEAQSSFYDIDQFKKSRIHSLMNLDTNQV